MKDLKKPTCRAWVMVTRRRNGGFCRAEYEMEELVKENSEVFKKCLSVYGHYDIVVPIEHEDLHGIHRAVNMIHSRGKKAVHSTVTCVAANPAFDNENRYREKVQVCLGIITSLGEQKKVRADLEAMPNFDLADVVFGEFDIIALFGIPDATALTTALTTLQNAIQKIPEILKTTTMLPVDLGPI